MSEQWYNDNSGSGDNENNNQNGYQYTSQEDYAFQTLMRNGRPKTKTLSVASMVLGILSVVCCCLGYVGIVFGIGAIVVSIISRKSLGYFDGMSIAGLLLGIFGFVFGVAIIIMIEAMPQEFWDEYYKAFEDIYGEGAGEGGGNGGGTSPGDM